ncbi:MAG: ABC transporter ATP-binding protein [Actinomycetota bacterium]
MLEVRAISVEYESKPLFTDLSLTINTGEIVALTGDSGSGKTTLLRCIAGVENMASGSIILDHYDITDQPAQLRRIGLVFQDNQLFPHLSVGQNIAYSLKLKGADKRTIQTKVAQALELVGLEDLANREVVNLSGGEAKRVAVARALVAEPRVLLLDEPLNGLDSRLHAKLLKDLGELIRDRGVTTLHVTHDHDEAAAIADRVIDLHQLIS